MPATQQDVARALGVSRATVSYVFSGQAERRRIPAALAERIRAAAVRLGYHPHHGARALASGRSGRLGLSLPTVDNDFWMRVAFGVQAACEHDGHDLLLVPGGEDRWRRCLAHLRERRIDALVLIGAVPPARVPAGLPVVQVADDGLAVPQVRLDEGPGLAAAVAHLAARGQRRLRWLGPDNASSRERLRLLRACPGVEVDACLLPWDDYPVGATIDAQIVHWGRHIGAALDACPPATLCWNDGVALGLYAVAQERGWRIGRDLPVVGFDDHHAPAAIPALTTISHRLPELGEAAARLALAAARGETAADLALPATLIVRAST
jgi:DNA-binding LacI/PurR family transcriptional regulator